MPCTTRWAFVSLWWKCIGGEGVPVLILKVREVAGAEVVCPVLNKKVLAESDSLTPTPLPLLLRMRQLSWGGFERKKSL